MGGLTPSGLHPRPRDIDFYLIQSMAHGLTEQHIEISEELKGLVDEWFAAKDKPFPRKKRGNSIKKKLLTLIPRTTSSHTGWNLEPENY